jgi:hypothetical protein
MAVTGTIVDRHSRIDSGRLVRWVFPDLKILSPQTVPFLKRIGIEGEPITNPKIEWYEDALNPETCTLSGAITTATATTFVVGTGQGYGITAGQLLRVPGTVSSVANVEYVYVTSISTDTLTVVRGAAGTTANTSIPDGTTMTKIGIARKENVAPPKSGTTLPELFYNYAQIFEKKWQIAQRMAATKLYGTNSDPAYQEAKKIKETMIELELACIYGKRADESGEVPYLMGGLDFFLSQNVTDLSGAPLELRHIMDTLQDIYYQVGPDEMGKTILCGMDVKQQINDWFAPYARSRREERTGGVVVDTIQTDFGDIDLLESFRCPKQTVFIIKPEAISIHPYKNGAFQIRDVPADGAYTIRRIYGDYTIRVGEPKAQGKIINVQLLNT